ncbi:MAG: helix-turn-helix domain-containing protein [Acidobacteriota bacterium]|nr:helix-turn-helix domain-containing protein [Acidobacteriota bacterium]
MRHRYAAGIETSLVSGLLMQYTEQRPSPALAQHLECLWFVSETDTSPAKGACERVFPDGCVEWIFHLGSPFQRSTTTGEWVRQPGSFVVGELTRFLLLQPTGDVTVMGVRFRPGRAYRFLPFPLSDVTDSMVPTGDVWGHKGTYLEEAVFEARNNMHRQQLVEEFLLQQLVTTTPRPRFEAAVKEIIRTRGQTRVHEVANGVGWSSRQLERDFRVSVGLSPKLFSRIMRFQNLLRLVGEGVLREWTSLALEGGYADQPHMVREFREFAGHTPAEQRIAAGEFGSYFVSPRRIAALLGPS